MQHLFLSITLATLLLVAQAPQAEPILDCVPEGNARPICEFTNPEDMVALPESEKQHTVFPSGDRILRVNLATTDVEENLAELMAIYGDSTIWPTEEQWRNILLYPNKQPIVTTSFLQLPTGEVHDEKVGFRGSVDEALAKYIEATTPIIERIGVRPVYVSGLPITVIGDGSNQWDAVAVTRHPSAEAFIELHLDLRTLKNRCRIAACTPSELSCCCRSKPRRF